MDAGRARLLREPRDQLFDLLADDHHHVGEFVDDDDDERQRLETGSALVDVRPQALAVSNGSRSGLPASLRVLHLLVEAGEVAHADRRHQLVAPLHLGDAPAQRVGGFLHVGDDRREQMRNALVHRQLQHLRVDHDHAHVLGASPCRAATAPSR